jgi:Fasciclin domain
MKMRTHRIVFVALCMSLATCFFSCKKEDKTYYDYENNIQRFDGSTFAYLQSRTESFSSLLTIIERLPELREILENREVTLFAPANESIALSLKYLNNVRQARNNSLPVITLQNADQTALRELVGKYIIAGRYTTEDFLSLIDGQQVGSIDNYPMFVKAVRTNASGFVGGGALSLEFSDQRGSIFPERWITTNTTSVNVSTRNGTINTLSALHNFGFDEFTNKLDK